MKIKFDVSSQELAIIQQVLQRALSAQCRVWVFGSRAKHQTKNNSDLDLAIECLQTLDKTTLMQLETAFDESRLPYSVDVVDMHKVEPYFKEIIDRQKVLFPLIANVPELRFPEFVDKWSEIPIGKHFPKIRNGFVGTATPHYVKEGVSYLQGKNIKNGQIDKKGIIYVSEEFHNKQNKSQLVERDILLVQSGHVGECAVVDKEFDGGNCHALIVMTPVEKVSSEFFVYYFYSSYGRKNIYRIKTGNTIEHVLTSDLKPLLIFTPVFDEQQKIAAFLSSVDDKLNKLRGKRELLETFKRGLMQKIFSQQLRFTKDDGTVFPDWEEKKLGSLTSMMQSGLSRLLSDQDLGLPVIRSNNIQNGKIDVSDIKYWFVEDNQGANTSSYILNEGDLLVNFINSIAQIGKVAIYEDILSRPAIFTTNIMRLQFTNLVEPKFLYYFCLTASYQKHIQAITKPAVNQASFTTVDFKKLQIFCPKIDEQKKIADFLSTIDKKIDAVNQQITQTETFKKGLLQKMFV